MHFYCVTLHSPYGHSYLPFKIKLHMVAIILMRKNVYKSNKILLINLSIFIIQIFTNNVLFINFVIKIHKISFVKLHTMQYKNFTSCTINNKNFQGQNFCRLLLPSYMLLCACRYIKTDSPLCSSDVATPVKVLVAPPLITRLCADPSTCGC